MLACERSAWLFNVTSSYTDMRPLQRSRNAANLGTTFVRSGTTGPDAARCLAEDGNPVFDQFAENSRFL
jgi:hypothetical protein